MERAAKQYDKRFIPTRVGYTLRFQYSVSGSSGSSPLAWGILNNARGIIKPYRFIPTRVGYTVDTCILCELAGRFIPTRVGYTIKVIKRLSTNAVHPHSRGVYATKSLFFPG